MYGLSVSSVETCDPFRAMWFHSVYNLMADKSVHIAPKCKFSG